LLKQSCINLEANEPCLILLLTSSKSSIHTFTKIKKKLEEVVQSESTKAVIDPPSPIRRHVKWKIIRTKKTSQMTSEAAKEIAEKIVSHFQLIIVIIYVYCVID